MSLCNYGFESYVTKASKVCKRVATKQISRLHKYRRSGFHPTAVFFVHSLCVHSARKETQFVVAFFRFISAHCQRPSGGGHVAIGRCSRGHRAVVAGNFVKKTEITEERTIKAGVHLSHCQASAAPCLCEKEVGILRKKCTASCSRAYDPAIKSGKYSGHFHKKFSGQDNILGVFRVFANSNNGKCAVRL